MDLILFKKTIQDFYLKCYDKVYDAKLSLDKIEDGNMFIYKIKMDLNNHEKPLVISSQCNTDDEFLDFVLCELNKRKLSHTEYFRLYSKEESVEEMLKRIQKQTIHEPETMTQFPVIIPSKTTYPILYGSSSSILSNTNIFDSLLKDYTIKEKKYRISANYEYIYLAFPSELGKIQLIEQNRVNVIYAFDIISTILSVNGTPIPYTILKTFDKTDSEDQEFYIGFQ